MKGCASQNDKVGILLVLRLITRPEKSYRMWCLVVCDRETSKNEAMVRVGPQRHRKYIYIYKQSSGWKDVLHKVIKWAFCWFLLHRYFTKHRSRNVKYVTRRNCRQENLKFIYPVYVYTCQATICCIRRGTGGEPIVYVVPGWTELEPLLKTGSWASCSHS